MSRLAAACSLLLAAVAAAPTPRGADGAAPATVEREGLTFDEVELLPLDDTRRQLVALEHADVWDKLHYLGRKRANARRRLARQKQPSGAAAKKLRAEIARYDAQLQPLLASLREAVREYGVGDDQLATLKRLKPPLGPRRDYRYAHRLVASVPGLSRDAERAERITRIVHGLDGAQLALVSQRKAVEAALREAHVKLEKPERQRLQRAMIRGLERQVGRMERRFWRLIDVLMTSSEKQWLRRHLPYRLTRLSDALGHVFRIPGLAPAQAARIKALLAEAESESTADVAELRRLQRAEREARRRPWPERKKLRDERREVQLRLAKLHYRTQQEGRKVLSAAQYAHLQSIPPQVTTRDRRLPLRRVLEGTALSPEQRGQVRSIEGQVAAGRRAAYADAGRVNRMGSNFGPDSPQQQTMMMMRLGMEGAADAALARGTREVFLDVLSPQQVVAWVVGSGR